MAPQNCRGEATDTERSVTTHSPAVHPTLHVSPQPPQLLSSVCVSTQAPLQTVSLSVHVAPSGSVPSGSEASGNEPSGDPSGSEPLLLPELLPLPPLLLPELLP